MLAPISTRAERLASLRERSFDLLVIGGGITGAGIARDAAARGLSVALIEKSDFASGTSSKSSKLIHGGLRYLEYAQFRLVFEGTNERALLMRVAPHLVRPLPFLVPSYRRDRPGLFLLDIGLWLYDGLSKFSSPKLHKTLNRETLLKEEPGLISEGLRGGIVYYDCMTDDARMTIENAIDADALGGSVINYVRATQLRKDGERVTGAMAVDQLTPNATPFEIKARVTVNATGPWCDDIRHMAGETSILGTSKGVHLVIDSARLPVRHAVVMKEKKRVVFLIPWGDRTVIGTTDTFYDDKPEVVATDRADAEYLLELANRYYPDAKLTLDDILATWAGLRPLIKPTDVVGSASDVSREHQIYNHPGMITIAGGKLTTYRRMAAEVVDLCGEQIGVLPACVTDKRPLPGAQGLAGGGLQQLVEQLQIEAQLPEATVKYLVDLYGTRAQRFITLIASDPSLRAPLDPEVPAIFAQVALAIDEESAATVEDVLGRRVPLILRARDQGLAIAPQVARYMQRRLGWSEARTSGEIAAYEAVVARTRAFRA